MWCKIRPSFESTYWQRDVKDKVSPIIEVNALGRGGNEWVGNNVAYNRDDLGLVPRVCQCINFIFDYVDALTIFTP